MTNKDLVAVGARIKQLRTDRGWSQEELGSRAGLDRSDVSVVERGGRNISFVLLCQICRALECDIATITHGIPTATHS
jgi:transcriptional regulator with XRE-family HTH domain